MRARQRASEQQTFELPFPRDGEVDQALAAFRTIAGLLPPWWRQALLGAPAVTLKLHADHRRVTHYLKVGLDHAATSSRGSPRRSRASASRGSRRSSRRRSSLVGSFASSDSASCGPTRYRRRRPRSWRPFNRSTPARLASFSRRSLQSASRCALSLRRSSSATPRLRGAPTSPIIKGQDEVSADFTPALADVLGEAAALRAIEQAEDRTGTKPVAFEPQARFSPGVRVRTIRGERRDLNPRPPGPQPGALPAELRPPCGPESSSGGRA